MRLLLFQVRPYRTGVSQIEVIISVVFVSLTITAAMHCFGVVQQTRSHNSDAGRGELMAEQLAMEILNTSYEDPDGSPVFGHEPGEFPGNRVDCDDVDDFDSWSSSPPKDRAGNALPNTAGWTRQVSVEYVQPGDPSLASVSDQGVKKITVSVLVGGQLVTRLVVLRCDVDF